MYLPRKQDKSRKICALCSFDLTEAEDNGSHNRRLTMSHQFYEKWLCGDCIDLVAEAAME